MLTLVLALVVLGTLGVLLKGVRRIWPAALPRYRILIVQVTVLAAWVVGGNALASLREHRAETAWAAVAAVDHQAASPVPGRGGVSANAPAVELVKLASALGIRVDKPGSAGALERDPVDETGLATLASYLDRVCRQADDRPVPAPTELRAWLLVQEPSVRAIEKHIVESGRIDWGGRADDDTPPYSPVVLFQLDGVLTAAALERSRAGDAAGASTALEAASGLAASLRDRPDTASRVFAVTFDRRLLGALRLIDPVAPGWERRLDEIEEHTRPLGALANESLALLAHAREPRTTLRGLLLETDLGPELSTGPRPRLGQLLLGLSGGLVPIERLADAVAAERKITLTSFYRYVQGPLEEPYMRLVAADYASVQVETAALVAAGDSCGPKRIEPKARLASWSPLAELDEPLLPRLARSAAVLRVELELTRLVMRDRTLRAQSAKKEWPGELPGADASRACSGRRFVASADATGALIRLDPNAFGEKEATVSFRMGAAGR